ncbi:7762_t:CDS:1 [Scutellospora calospora]|uniref:7762_t:CDS:1 n=1 Tax=Scutellospora calospora TaxID=85575 RepID=A0ACA9K1M5_9GLOM|nr:7762_t:CDS:1 [Scutellospora calospora]
MMNRNFIFVFVLLVMLSIVNAIPHQLHKRTTDFRECTFPPGYPTPDLLTVTISPDPVVPGKNDNFTVNGKLTQLITSSDRLNFVFSTDNGGPFTTQIPTGTTVNVTVDVPVPSPLPSIYGIAVSIGDLSVQPLNVKACALAVVGGQ